MRFAFFLPALRIDDSGYTLEEFLRNLANAVKISSADNYPYPLYEHYYAAEGGDGGAAHLRSDEFHRLFENFLHRYKVLPEEALLVKEYKRVRKDIDAAGNRPARLVKKSLGEYLFGEYDFPALKQCLDMLCHYFLDGTTNTIDAAEGLRLLDRCFFTRTAKKFPEDVLDLRDEEWSRHLARATLSMEFDVEKRYRRDRLYMVLFDNERPTQCTNSFFVHFTQKDDQNDIAHIHSILSEDEVRHYGSDGDSWDDLKKAVRAKFDSRFTYSRQEVSLT